MTDGGRSCAIARMEMIERPSPNFDERASPVSMIVLHYTGMPDAEGALDRLTSPDSRVSAHYLVDEDGRIFSLVDESMRAWHAGKSSWRGVRGGIEAARAGHDVVMAPTTHTYLDYYQARPEAQEPIAIGGYLPIDTVYAFEPIPAELTPEQARHVLGAQAQLWTEYMPNPKKVEYMAFPRLTALAEVVWTPRERKDFGDFRARLVPHLQRLDRLDVNYRPLEGRRGGAGAGAR